MIDNSDNLCTSHGVQKLGDVSVEIVAVHGVNGGYLIAPEDGGIITWFGSGQRYPDWVTALQAIARSRRENE